MAGKPSEDTLLFIGLTPKVVKIKSIFKVLEEFAHKKQSGDGSERFNVIFFQENGPVYLDDFTFNFENILNLLKDYEKKIVKANIAGGIFVACTFIIDVYKKISDKAFRLIILTDKGAHKIPDYYLPVLTNLLDKVREMPLYIDILQLGDIEYEVLKKYKLLTEKCSGKIYQIPNPKTLSETLSQLTEKKTKPGESYFEKNKKTPITPENEPFYENLADKPKILITSETCSICFKKDDVTVVQCPNCDGIAHMSCWAHWAKTSNIGIPYVFRCHNCFDLLKLDKQFVEIVQTGKAPPMELPKKVDLVSYLHELEAKNAPQAVYAEDPLSIMEEEGTEDEFEEAPPMDFSSQLEPIPQQQPQRIRELERPPQSQPRSQPIRPQPAIQPQPQAVRPLESRFRQRRSDETKILICSNCSNIGTSKDKFCSKCGFTMR